MKLRNNKIMTYLFLWIYATVLMLFCAGSSPIIQYLSPDSSIFFTMGRSAANGTILFKEIADHKGFYLFAFNWLGAALTPNSMNGLFVVEILFAAGKLMVLYNLANLYFKNVKKSIISATVFLALSTNFLSWNTGDLGEQFALLFQLISFYFIAKYVKGNLEQKQVLEHHPLYMFYHGICATIVLFIQGNLVAMWIPFGIGLAIILLSQGYLKNFLRNLCALFGGVLASSLPVLCYGIKNDCIEEMYYVMFEINFLYSTDGRKSTSIIPYIKEFIFSPSAIIVLFAFTGCMIVALYFKKTYITIIFSFMLICSIVFMSVSLNANPIYYTVYLPFAYPLIIWATDHYLKDRYFFVPTLCILAITVIFNMQLVKRVLHIGSSSYAYESAYEMRDYIEDKSDKVLVLGNSLYYNCTNTLPHIRYFTIFGSNLSYDTFPDCINEQMQSLCSCENKYIIIQFANDGYTFWSNQLRDSMMSEILEENYELIYEYNKGGIHSGLYELDK